MDTTVEKCLLDGTIWYWSDTLATTHNPWVVGSIPTRPTDVRCPMPDGPGATVRSSHGGHPESDTGLPAFDVSASGCVLTDVASAGQT